MTAQQLDSNRANLAEKQLQRLKAILDGVLPRNQFYRDKFRAAGLSGKDVRSLDDLERIPFTTKSEIVADQAVHPPYGRNLTYPLERYSRIHQTSGTTGKPMRWLDTKESWDELLGRWRRIYEIAGITSSDRLFFAFSFGPFLGFWSAFEAATSSGYFSFPGGGMSSSARLRAIFDNDITALLCTPTYALRLAEVAAAEGIDLARSGVEKVIVAGEPGGNLEPTRTRIQDAWRARLLDHCGMTEIGPIGIECLDNPGGMHLLEDVCMVEVVDPTTGQVVAPGETGELVVTNLERWGTPLIRYRTGDLVKANTAPCLCGRPFVRLANGILGRTDDMIHIRGNNVYPSALESVIGRFAEVAEYQIEIDERGSLPEVRIQLEPVYAGADDGLADRVGRAIHEAFMFRAEVKSVAPGSLPRFEMKAKRVQRKK
jgi:phenylacetate-CoA ligase